MNEIHTIMSASIEAVVTACETLGIDRNEVFDQLEAVEAPPLLKLLAEQLEAGGKR